MGGSSWSSSSNSGLLTLLVTACLKYWMKIYVFQVRMGLKCWNCFMLM